MTDAVWWKRGIVYQIYPRSFQDTNGDGIGDLAGIRQRLDYLAGLGVDAIWISPIYPSPMKDFGYDVADYCDIHPMFGTLAEFDALVAEAHRRGLKVILDFVPNHTSDQHPWFLESRSSRSNPKRSWYHWRDAKPDGSPPNNWMSHFGGSAWQWDEATGQYYYHAFLKEQPDLDWRNPDVVAAMHDVLRFWMDRGVDGFRVDVMWLLMKDPDWTDNPVNPAYEEGQRDLSRFLEVHSADHPDVLGVVEAMRRVLDEYEERVLIGEIYLPVERLVAYYGKDLAGAHLPFNFQLIQASWAAPGIAAMIHEYEAALPAGGWPNWVLGNHDRPRIAARVGEAQARVAAMLLLTLRGTPTLYYGDEIGIGRVEIPPELVQDPAEKNEPGLGQGRDPERTPMQWDASAQAGFTTGKPWLPLTPDYRDRNVMVEAADPDSMLSLYKRLIALRRAHPALSLGAYLGREASGDLLVYERRAGAERFLIALNLGHAPQAALVPEDAGEAEVLISTLPGRVGETARGRLELRPDEGVVARLATRGAA